MCIDYNSLSKFSFRLSAPCVSSMGGVSVRAALATPEFQKYHKLLHTFVSLAVPHLGNG